jgi:hypothetical protein
MLGGFSWRESTVADQASPHADHNKDFAHALDLTLFHCVAPAALACSGMFPTSVGAVASGLAFESFIKRHIAHGATKISRGGVVPCGASGSLVMVTSLYAHVVDTPLRPTDEGLIVDLEGFLAGQRNECDFSTVSELGVARLLWAIKRQRAWSGSSPVRVELQQSYLS